MKGFGRAAIFVFYNAQTNDTRKDWSKSEVKEQAEEALRKLLTDLHPNPKCRKLLAEDNIVLKHILYHVMRDFRGKLKSNQYLDVDENWIPAEYANSLKDWKKPRLDDIAADGHAESTANVDENSLNDFIDFNAFPPLSSFSGNIEDGDAMGDLDPIPEYHASQDFRNLSLPPNDAAIESNLNTIVNLHDIEFSKGTSGGIGAPFRGYHASQDPYSLSLPPNDAAIESHLNTTVNLHDIEFSKGTSGGIGAPLPKISKTDEDVNTRNDAYWDAFVETENSNPVEDIDTILGNATSLNAQRAVQVPHMTQQKNTSLNRNPYTFVNFDSYTRSNTASTQRAVQVPGMTQRNNASLNCNTDAFIDFDLHTRSNTALTGQTMQAPDMTQRRNTSLYQNPYTFVNSDLLSRSNTARNENSNVIGYSSAVPEQNYFPSSNADAIGNCSVGQRISPFLNDFSNAAGDFRALSRNETSFDLEWTTPYENPNLIGYSSALPKQNNLPSSNANAISNYSVGRRISAFRDDFAGNSRTLPWNEGSSDLECNAAWYATDWTPINRSRPDLDAPRDGYQDYKNATF